MQADAQKCKTATKGKDKCWGHVNWAMTTGIKSNPKWYPGLTAKSTFGVPVRDGKTDGAPCASPTCLEDNATCIEESRECAQC
jgi:hypothetical protein